ncbi:MAG: hypothetical protein FWH15_07865 [Betaproteobacteria bacterium]|nr:hypothetical protein [Betaproteobacteria bacterium]
MNFLCNFCLLLVALKLLGVIDWSWLIVLMPVWLPLLLLVALALWVGGYELRQGKQ